VRFLTKAIVASTLAVGAAVAVAAPASAHNYLVDSSPEAGESLSVLPESFSVTTNEKLLDLGGEGNGFGLSVQDAAGRYYGDGCVSVDGTTLSTDAAIGEPGTYTVTWQVVSADGHPVSDTFAFEWTGAATAEGAATRPDCDGRYATEPAPAASGSFDATPLWIGGAVLLVAVAIVVTLLLMRPKKGTTTAG
jgi:methionine-rich copper-binding protein CopC